MSILRRLDKIGIAFGLALFAMGPGCGGGGSGGAKPAASTSPSTTGSTSALAQQGGWSSSGGDNQDPTDGMLWYLGPGTVHFCIQSAPDFGVPVDTVRAAILDAVGTWTKYLADKDQSDDGSDGAVNTNFQAMPACDGSEDLTFYLGVPGPWEAQQARKLYDNPSAYTIRGPFPADRTWAKGAVWVATSGSISRGFPNWLDPNALKAILLHELGHILGCGHVDGTVMRADISDQLRLALSGTGTVSRRYTAIDQSRELLMCQTCALDVTGRIGPDAQNAAAAFSRFLGRAAAGAITARVTEPAGDEDDPTRQPGLTIADTQGSRNFTVQLIPGAVDEPWDSTDLLKKPDSSAHAYSMTAVGNVLASDGTNYTVKFSRSVDRILHIQYLLPDGAHDLFDSSKVR